MRYRRNYQAGGTYFFTVNLLERNKSLLVDHIDLLRESVRWVKRHKPFHIDAWVVTRSSSCGANITRRGF